MLLHISYDLLDISHNSDALAVISQGRRQLVKKVRKMKQKVIF
jgi:ABC-type uncharacterized transport system ATPase subunit